MLLGRLFHSLIQHFHLKCYEKELTIVVPEVLPFRIGALKFTEISLLIY